MDIFNFCWNILLVESKKCCVFFDKNTCNVKNDIDQNFAKPVSRIAYLYKFGSYNISFFHQCFNEFFTKCPDSSKVIGDFRDIKNLNICSMSAGPGTDIIGLLYSLYLLQKPLMKSATFRIISRDGNWRNLVNEMMYSSNISECDKYSCHLTGCDFLKNFSQKAQSYLKAADILLMCDSFTSSGLSETKICDALKMTIKLLKPGVLVFLIFSKEKSTCFEELYSCGSFLYGPVEVVLENMPYNEKIAELVGVKPLCSGRSMFAVWRKFHKIKREINAGQEIENGLVVGGDQQSSTKGQIKDINSLNQSMSGLKREFLSDTNISSSESTASSSWLSTGSIPSQIINRKDKPVPNNLVNHNVQSIGFSEMHFNSAKNVSSSVLNSYDSLMGKKCASTFESGQNKIESEGYNMNSLLKNFESLITKFEGLISSQDTLKSPCVKDEKSSNCRQNLQQGHVKPCQFYENGLTCHSMVCNDVNFGTCNCSSSVASNLYKILPQEGPSLVIPLRNLSNESLTQILSIVSQNCSSVDKTSTFFSKKERS